DLAHAKLATIYDQTFLIESHTVSPPRFTIGSTFDSRIGANPVADSGNATSLRARVNTANQHFADGHTGTQTIQLDPGVYDVTDSSRGSIHVHSNVVILGAGANQTTIAGLNELGAPLFVVDPGATVTLEGVTLTLGGGPLAVGGGIANRATLTVSNCVISQNSRGQLGGGIYNESGGTLTVIDSDIKNNSTDGYGGGIVNEAGGTLTVSNSVISENSAYAGGGIDNLGNATVNNTTFS